MKLFEIAEDLLAALEDYDDETGEYSPEAAARIEAVEMSFTAKVEGTARFICNQEATAAAYRTEARRMACKAQARSNVAESRKAYLLEQMVATGQHKVAGELLTVRIQKSPPALNVLNEAAIPEHFFTVPAPCLEWAEVRAAIQRGEAVPGAELCQGRHIRIT